MDAYGPGLESPVSGKPTNFTLDTRKAGAPAPVDVIAKADGEEVPVKVDDLGNGLYECSYTPIKPTKHTIIPSYDSVAVKDSPFRVCTQFLLNKFTNEVISSNLSRQISIFIQGWHDLVY